MTPFALGVSVLLGVAVASGHPDSSPHAGHKPDTSSPQSEVNKKVKAIAGTSEFLRLLPKPFATLKSVDAKLHAVTLLMDGEKEVKTWPLEPDAEIKVGGWWGRLEQFQPGDRVWVWLKLNRKKAPVSIVMLADEASEFDMHASLHKKPVENPKFTAEEIEAKRVEQKAWLRKRWAGDGLPAHAYFSPRVQRGGGPHP